jgi:molybdopterin-guanine dinucleotide biosynthesis protein A
MRITGVIQAGGRSVRMGGQPKALMELGGRRIIDRVADVVRAVADDVLIVTNTPELYASLDLPMVPDAFPEHGSLGGIYSGLRAAPGDAAFTVACDMPFLMVEVARLVTERAGEADVVVPRVGGQWETLHACYAKACLGPIEARLRAGQLRIVGFYDEVRVLAITEDEVAQFRAPEVVFMNVNTPEDLEAARRLLAALEPGGAPAGPR